MILDITITVRVEVPSHVDIEQLWNEIKVETMDGDGNKLATSTEPLETCFYPVAVDRRLRQFGGGSWHRNRKRAKKNGKVKQ